MSYCFERELIEVPELAGQFVASWQIDADGQVIGQIGTSENTLENADVEGCVQRHIQRMRFDQPTGDSPVAVKFTLTFSP